MAQNNAINNKTAQLTIDPGASGDSFVQLDINTTGEFRFGVDDTDDSFRIAQGSALGTNDVLKISAAGEVNLPLNCAFLAYIATDDDNVCGAGTPYKVGTNVAFTEVFDVGGNFNTNGTFTAPVTGKFFLIGAVRLETPAGGGNQGAMRIVTSNRTFIGSIKPQVDRVAGFVGAGSSLTYHYGVLADMDAGDTAELYINAENGADTCDILGSTTMQTFFAGYLAS